MNDPDNDLSTPEATAPAAPAAKRKRAPRKTAAQAAQTASDAPTGEPTPGGLAAAAASPAPQRPDAIPSTLVSSPASPARPPRARARKTGAPEAQALEPVGEGPVPGRATVREDAAARGEQRQQSDRVTPAAPAPAALPGLGDVASAMPLVPAEAAVAATAASNEATQEIVGETMSGKGRSRNRRRGRRGGERREPAELLAAATPVAGELFAQVLTGRFDAESESEPQAAPAADAGPGLDAADPAMGPGVHEAAATPGHDAGAGPEADAVYGSRPAVPEPEPARRVLAPEADAPKLHKVLAQSGAGSRRDLEQMIASGRVSVNGEVAHTGQRISWGDRIAVDGKPVRVRIAPPPARVLAYHKPAGEVVTHDDPQQRPTVFRRLPRLQQGKWQSVGRLDINTEGLLLFTNSGELANQLMHPRFGIEREYAVRSLGTLGAEAKARLLEGVPVDGQLCAFKSIEDGGGEGVNHWYRCVITEGRNREVRRLFEAVGHAVSRLIRIRYGSVVLPRGLKRGVWVDLDERDLRNLRSVAAAGAAAAQQGKPAAQGGGASAQSQPGQRDDKPARKQRGRGPQARQTEPGLPAPQPAGRGGRNSRGGPAPNRAERDPRRHREGVDTFEGEGDLPPGFIPDPLQTSLPSLGVKRSKLPQPLRRPYDERDFDDDVADGADAGPIPNPLQQTYDKRAIQQARSQRREVAEDGPIPNPLQQTYDKRALMRERTSQRELPEDGPIPNPLQQTYDKRFASGGGGGQGKSSGTRGKRGVKGSGLGAAGQAGGTHGAGAGPGAKPGGGRGKGGPSGQGAGKPGAGRPGGKGAAGGKGGKGGKGNKAGGSGGPGGGRQPDPLQTAVGYIGGDAYLRKGAGKGRGGGTGGAGPRGGNPRGGRGGLPR